VDPEGEYALLGDTQFGHAPEWGYNRGGSYRSQGLKAFRQSGFAIVRQGGSYLATTAGFFNTTHKHADELDFELFDRGLKIVNGPGNYGYDREEVYRDYQLSSASHSVLLADDMSFDTDVENVYGSAMRATGQGSGWYAIQGSNPLLAKQGISHSRLFLYSPGRALVVVDQVRSGQPHTYHRYFQLGPQVSAQARSPATLGLAGPGLTGGIYDASSASGAASRVLVRGRQSPLQGFTFPGFRRAVPRWSVDYVSEDTNADYIATFTLDGAPRAGTVAVPSANRTEVTLTDSDGSQQVISVTRNGAGLSISVH
jgi:hypothetical protein